MNGGADLGGMMGFGPVVENPKDAFFDAPWEARVLGIVVALGACGKWSIDMSRAARESLPPADYMSLPYYIIWLDAALNLMLERGMITQEEIDTATLQVPPVPVARTLAAADVEAVLGAGAPANRPEQGQPLFAVGDTVHTINNHPQAHTRMARYARDKRGTVTKVHGFHVFADSNAQGTGENPQWLYQVTFSTRTLWGDQGNDIDTVTLDLWESYLKDPAS